MIVHHTGSHGGDRPRGASSMVGNADSVLIAKKMEDSGPTGPIVLIPTKQRSNEKSRTLKFQIKPFQVGISRRGRPVFVPMAVPLDDGFEEEDMEEEPLKQRSLAELRMDDAFTTLKKLDTEQPQAWVDAAEDETTPFQYDH